MKVAVSRKRGAMWLARSKHQRSWERLGKKNEWPRICDREGGLSDSYGEILEEDAMQSDGDDARESAQGALHGSARTIGSVCRASDSLRL